MLNKYNGALCSIIFITTFLILPIESYSQTKPVKASGLANNTKSSSPQIKQLSKTNELKKQFSGSTKVSKNIKALEKKLKAANTELSKAKKAEAKNTKNVKKLKSDLAKFPNKIKELEKKLKAANTELSKAKKAEAKKVEEVKKIQSASEKFPAKIKEVEDKLLLANGEIEEAKTVNSNKDEEISQLNGDINYLLDTLDKLDEKYLFQINTSEKYKELIMCYRSALVTWYDMNGRKNLKDQDYSVIRFVLRDSLFSCPPYY